MIKNLITLKNGLRVVLAEHHAAPVVSFQAWVGAGSANEAKGEAGICHVIEHMLFKGTAKRKTGAIARDVENAGGYINAWTSHDETVFHITLASRYRNQGLDILSDAITNAAIDEIELQRELEVIREEIRMGEDSPGRVVLERLFKNSFKGHPYSRPVIGYDRTVRNFTRGQVYDFYRRYYTPQNIVLVVCGDFSSDKMLKQIEAHLGGFEGPKKPVYEHKLPQGTRRTLHIDSTSSPFAEAVFALGLRTPPLGHEDTSGLDLLSAIAGQGMSSRLERDLLRTRGLVSEIRAMNYTPQKGGVFCVYGFTSLERIQPALTGVFESLQKLCAGDIHRDEIQKAKTLLESDAVFAEETVDGIAKKLGFFTLHLGQMDYEERYLQELSRFDVKRLTETAQKYLSKDSANIVALLPKPDGKTTSKKVPFVKKGVLDQQAFSKSLQSSLSKIKSKAPKAKTYNGSHSKTETVIHTLASGDTLIVRSEPGSHYAAARIAVLGGVLVEPKNKGGLATLYGSLLTQGTASMNSHELSVRMDELSCVIGGYSGRSSHGLHAEFLARNFGPGLRLMSDCLHHPTFPETELKRELELQRDELTSLLDDPVSRGFTILRGAMYGNHPYGSNLLGSEDSLASIERDHVVAYHRKHTEKQRKVFSIVGGIEASEAIELAQTFLAQDKAQRFKTPTPPDPRLARLKPKILTNQMDREQSHVFLGFPGARVTSKNRHALELVAEILGGHGGRLFAVVRDRHSLCYHVTAGSWEGLVDGMFTVYAATSPGQENQLIDLLRSEIRAMAEKGAKRSEVERVKKHNIGSRAITKQRATTRAAALAYGELYGLGHDILEKDEQELARVTIDDVHKAAAQYLDESKMTTVCIGPNSKAISLA